jgi:hypothetical protein
MPYIEEQRQQLIEQYGQCFKPIFYKKIGLIDDVYDLEIGVMELLLSRSCVRPNATVQFVSDLKLARNRLSHLSPVEPDLQLRLRRNEADR